MVSSSTGPVAARGAPPDQGGRGRRPVPLPGRLQPIHSAYVTALAGAPLSPETRRTYASKVRQYLAWLPVSEVADGALTDPAARDRAVRAWRDHLLTVAGQAPTTVNNALAAVDDFYSRRGLGRANAERTDPPPAPRRGLNRREQLRWLRAVAAQPSPRDRTLAGLPFYAGARIAETVRLDTDDVHLTARTGDIRLRSAGDRTRDTPLHPTLRDDLRCWLTQRQNWRGADTNPALFLNHRGGRLTVRGARDIIARVAAAAGLDDTVTAEVLRHTFTVTLVRGGTDPVIVARLLGTTRLDLTRGYTEPTATARTRALTVLAVDRPTASRPES